MLNYFLLPIPDHSKLHAQIPAKGPHHQEEGPHRLTAQPQIRGVPHLHLHRDRLHGRNCLPESAGEFKGHSIWVSKEMQAINW